MKYVSTWTPSHFRAIYKRKPLYLEGRTDYTSTAGIHTCLIIQISINQKEAWLIKIVNYLPKNYFDQPLLHTRIQCGIEKLEKRDSILRNIILLECGGRDGSRMVSGLRGVGFVGKVSNFFWNYQWWCIHVLRGGGILTFSQILDNVYCYFHHSLNWSWLFPRSEIRV